MKWRKISVRLIFFPHSKSSTLKTKSLDLCSRSNNHSVRFWFNRKIEKIRFVFFFVILFQSYLGLQWKSDKFTIKNSAFQYLFQIVFCLFTFEKKLNSQETIKSHARDIDESKNKSFAMNLWISYLLGQSLNFVFSSPTLILTR